MTTSGDSCLHVTGDCKVASPRQVEDMASSADLECWKALGGKVTEVKKRKRFISPTGNVAPMHLPMLGGNASLAISSRPSPCFCRGGILKLAGRQGLLKSKW